MSIFFNNKTKLVGSSSFLLRFIIHLQSMIKHLLLKNDRNKKENRNP
jgi:hypothetical protein